MHKKVIGGRTYYYTSYRDKQGRVKTKYLGTDEHSAFEEEKRFQAPSIGKNYIIIASLLMFAFVGLVFLKSFTGGFFFAESSSIVEFDLNETWNLSNSFVRISQNLTVFDVGLNDLVVDTKILVDLGNYNLTNDNVYVDLIVDSVVVDSAHVNYFRIIEEPLVNLTANETIEEIVNITVEVEEAEEQDTSVNFDSYEEVGGKFNAIITLDTETYSGIVDFYELDSLNSVDSVEVYDPVGEGIQTTIISATASYFTNATVYAQMVGFVEKIVRCNNWNGVVCLSGWEEYTKDFNQNDTYVWFNVSSFSAYAGWYNPTSNVSDTLQIDYAIIDKERPSQNETLTCQNGSVSGDVTELLYYWYVNDTYVPYQNLSTLGPGNFTEGDKVECGIIAQNGTNLLGYFGIDEAKGSQLYELVHNNTLLIRGDPTWGNFSGHKALTFDGVDDYAVNMSPVRNLDSRNNFSVEAWVKPATMTNIGGIVSKENNWALRYKSGRITFLMNPVGSNFNEVAFTVVSPALVWQHYAATYNGSVITLYRDGIPVKITAFSTDINVIDGALNIGLLNSTKQFFNGSIGEVVVYNRSLSDSEVLEHYQNLVMKYSEDYLKVETNSEHFNNGTNTQTNTTWQLGNITLANESINAFYSSGNFTSQVIETLNNPVGDSLSWSEDKSDGENITLQVRSGEKGYNGSVIWSEFSGQDYVHAGNSNMVFGTDFGENNGNISKDYGTGNVAINLNPLVSRVYDGMFGSAVYLDAKGGFLTANEHSLMRLDDVTNFTMQVWIKPQSTTSNCIFNKEGGYIMILVNGKIRFSPIIDGNTALVISSSTIPTNEWTHIAVTYDNATLILYINGAVEDTQAVTGFVNSSLLNLLIGKESNGNTNYFNGTIDSLALYSSTFSATEIKNFADNKFTNSTGEKIGHVNQFVQYKALLETNNTNSTPTIQSVVLGYSNYSTNIYNAIPTNISLINPNNGTVLSSITNFNWTNSSDLEDNNTIYYEYVIGNDINLYNVTISGLSINNYSEYSYEDDNYTLLIEHFHSLKDVDDNGWTRVGGSSSSGKFGDGIKFSSRGEYIVSTIPAYFNEAGAVEFWIKPEWNGNSSSEHLIDGHFFFTTPENSPRLLSDSGILFLFVGTNKYISYNISSWSAGEWHHVVANWQSGYNYSLILDGVLVNESNITTIDPLTTNLLYFGSSSTGTQTANATFEELRISKYPRNDLGRLRSVNLTINPALYNDDVYYWKVRSFNYNDRDLDGEGVFSNWSEVRSVTLDTTVPSFNSYIQRFLFTLDSAKSLNVTTSEDSNCYYRNSSMEWTIMNNTGGLGHSQNLTINSYGFYTYYIICNDSQGKEGNDTISFAVMNSRPNYYNQSFKYDFYAGNQSNFTFMQNNLELINLTVSVGTNLTAYINFIKFNSNPEQNLDNLPSVKCSHFYTILMDENLIGNLTLSNISIHYDIPILGNTSNVDLYNFNLSTAVWDSISNARKTGTIFNLNTSNGRTFFVATDGRTDPPPSSTVSEGIPDEEEVVDEEEWYECGFDSECGEGYECINGWCVWTYDEEDDWTEDDRFEEKEDEGIVDLESDEEEQGTVMQIAEGFLGKTGATVMITGAYIGGGAIIGYYLMFGLLALIFFFRKKYDVGNIEVKEIRVAQNKLEAYIFSQLDQGVSEEELTNTLVSKGWDRERIERIIRKV